MSLDACGIYIHWALFFFGFLVFFLFFFFFTFFCEEHSYLGIL